MSARALDETLPWPRPGDELFAEASDWWMNACVNWGGGSSIYEIGYRRAGDALVEEVARNRHDADSLVYPIVFCYRQYLELLLKDVLAEARRYFDIDKAVPAKHSLAAVLEPPAPPSLSSLAKRRRRPRSGRNCPSPVRLC